ncbi:kinase-associated lipoprotein B [Bacillaceae bacterium IKA-2]|nr:kinase-associated lipoprotein B [Bacillaceae bacterium IKA-2]
MSQLFEVGLVVTGIYKTGKYIGEITMVKEPNYVVRVLAVLKHPQQGDLHNPKMAEVGFFHERRALAYREQVNIQGVYIKPYDGELPSYQDSLTGALEEQYQDLQQDGSPFAIKALEKLAALKADYFK